MATVPVETRRAQRVVARCSATVAFGGGRWEGETEDLGAGGCRFLSRLALRPGEPVSLRLSHQGVPFELEVVGTVAWTARRPPWRTGVAFVRGQEEAARRFLRAVVATAPRPASSGGPGFRSLPAPLERRQPTGSAELALRAGRVRALIAAALAEATAGRAARAIQWLRAALQLAPGDPEITAALEALGAAEPSDRRED